MIICLGVDSYVCLCWIGLLFLGYYFLSGSSLSGQGFQWLERFQMGEVGQWYGPVESKIPGVVAVKLAGRSFTHSGLCGLCLLVRCLLGLKEGPSRGSRDGLWKGLGAREGCSSTGRWVTHQFWLWNHSWLFTVPFSLKQICCQIIYAGHSSYM